MRNICIICHTNIKNDPRVYRQVRHFAKNASVTVIGNGEPLDIPNVTMYPWNAFYHRAANIFEKGVYCLALLCRKFSVLQERFSLNAFPELREEKFDYVIVNEINSLLLGLLVAKGAPVHCDLHEYYVDAPQSLHGRISAPFIRWLCTDGLKKCATLSTVSFGLARLYEDLAGKKPEVIINAPTAGHLPVVPCTDGKIQLIYHGYAEKNRHLENLVQIAALLDERFSLTFMLTRNSPEKKHLMDISAPYPNILFREAVPMEEICATINAYDMGIIHFGESTRLNRKYCLPNKFFEAIQAHLALAVGPSPEMGPLVANYDVGVVAEDFRPETLARQLNALTCEDVMRFKRNTVPLSDMFSAEAAMRKLEAALFPAQGQCGSTVAP